MILAALSGFLLGGSLIIAIGAQNAYILRMGLIGRHVFWLCLFCAVSDALLIILGVSGLGALVGVSPGLLKLISLGGALFLAIYAFIAIRRSFIPQSMEISKEHNSSLKAALGLCFAFTWLNPHVYLDTVMLVGSYAAQYQPRVRIAYAAGAVSASFIWFFALGFGAKFLVPFFKKPIAWRLLDLGIALIMAMLSISLFASTFD